MLLSLLFAAPWLVAIAWVVRRKGLSVLFPRDHVSPSFGELARRRAAIR
jgi:hypothetical protein